MRVQEDPRGAAKLFCGQYGITDAKTIDLLGETLAELHSSSPSSPSSSSTMLRPAASLASQHSRPPPPPPLEAEQSTWGAKHSTRPSPPPLEAEESTWGAPRTGDAGVDGGGAAAARGYPSGTQAGRDAEEALAGPLAGKRVEEIAQKMRTTAKASHDPADPSSVFVDLLVNGDPAPLVFRVPPKKAPRRQPRLSDGGVSERQGGMGQQQGKGEEEEEEWGLEKEWEEDENIDEAIAAAAAAWCREFRANRPEDIAFVEAEIEKAVESAATAASAATAVSAAARPTAATVGGNGRHAPTAASEARNEGPSAAVSGAPELLQGKNSELSDKDGVGRNRSDREDGSSSRRRAGRGTGEERLTLSSVLAPDVETGTSIFWVKVDPSLPEAYVTAGSSALEISERFCRTHNLGPSQVPLVAWKLLDAYPAQMEAARRDATLLPERVTLRHAACQREVQVAFVLIVAVLWVARSRRWWLFKRGTPAPADYRRRKKGAALILSRAYRLMARAWGRRRSKSARGRRAVIPSPGECKGETPPVSQDRGGVHTSFIGRYLFGRVLRTAQEKNIAASCAEVNGDGPATAVAPTIAAKSAPRKGAMAPTEAAVDFTNAHDENNDHRGSNKNGDDEDNRSDESLPSSGWLSSLLSSWAEAALFEAGRVAGTFVRVAVMRPLTYVRRRGTKPDTPASPSKAKSKPVSVKSRRRNAKSNNPRRPGVVTPKRPRIAATGDGKTREPRTERPVNGDVNLPGTCEGAGTCGVLPASVPPGRMIGAGRDIAEQVAAKPDPVSGRGSWTSVLDGLSRDPGNRFMQAAVLSSVGKVLARTDSFDIETHEACDWVRLFKSKKGDITVGGRKLMVLSRQEGSIILSNKALGSKMIGHKTRSGTVVLGTYTDLSKLEARESVTWLADALASAPVR